MKKSRRSSKLTGSAQASSNKNPDSRKVSEIDIPLTEASSDLGVATSNLNITTNTDYGPDWKLQPSQELRYTQPRTLNQPAEKIEEHEQAPLSAQYSSGQSGSCTAWDEESVDNASRGQGEGGEHGHEKGSTSPSPNIGSATMELSKQSAKDFKNLSDRTDRIEPRIMAVKPQDTLSPPYTATTPPHKYPSAPYIKHEECLTSSPPPIHQDQNLHDKMVHFLNNRGKKCPQSVSTNQHQIKHECDQDPELVEKNLKNESTRETESVDLGSSFEEKHELSDHDEDDDEDPEDDTPLMQRCRMIAPLAGPSDQYESQYSNMDLEKLSGSSTSASAGIPSFESSSGRIENSETHGVAMDWKLPKYEVTSFTDPAGYEVAKVSIPGLVRQELLLSLDHSEEELLLIRQVFLPGHEKVYTDDYPDTEPRHSIFSFHTIANILFGVYDSFRDDPSFPSAQSARDIDVDKVFFAAIDNWRVGLEMNRAGYKAIRGIQEFCDVTLEIAFWIKEHGLAEDANERQRAARCDKAVKKGPTSQQEANRLQAKSKPAPSARRKSTKTTKRKGSAKAKGGRVEKKRK